MLQYSELLVTDSASQIGIMLEDGFSLLALPLSMPSVGDLHPKEEESTIACMKLDPRVITSGSEVRCHSEAFRTLFASPAPFHSFNPTSVFSRSCRTLNQLQSFAVSVRATDGTLVHHGLCGLGS